MSLVYRGGVQELQLASVDLSDCDQFDDTTLRRLAQMCPKLTCLLLNGLYNITDAGVRDVVMRARQLKMIEAHNTSLSDKVGVLKGNRRLNPAPVSKCPVNKS